MSLFPEMELERDADGEPVALHWRGDVEHAARKTPAELEAEKLAEYERVYGKREEEAGGGRKSKIHVLRAGWKALANARRVVRAFAQTTKVGSLTTFIPAKMRTRAAKGSHGKR